MIGVVILVLCGLIGGLAGWTLRTWPVRHCAVQLAIGIALLLAGGMLIVTENERVAQEWRQRSWPTTEGTIVVSRVIGTRAFRPDVMYEYTVSGVTYRDSTTFDTPAFGGRNSKYNVAETIAKAYPPGRKVTVHYDPAEPSHSGLRAGPTWDLYGKIGFGGVLFGLGTFAVLVVTAGNRRRPSAAAETP